MNSVEHSSDVAVDYGVFALCRAGCQKSYDVPVNEAGERQHKVYQCTGSTSLLLFHSEPTQSSASLCCSVGSEGSAILLREEPSDRH